MLKNHVHVTSSAQSKPMSLRARAMARLGVDVGDEQGLATTETVILTAFLVAVAVAGGAILMNALTTTETTLNNKVSQVTVP